MFWKTFIFQAENMGPNALRQVEPFLVTKEEWQEFLSTHDSLKFLVPESNEMMRTSYLILDEYMRFV